MELREALKVIGELLTELYAKHEENGYDYELQQRIDALEIAEGCIQYKMGMG